MKYIKTFCCLFVVLYTMAIAQAQIHFSTNADVQIPLNYPTGLGWWDMDHNGYPDMVVSTGLDLAEGPTLIYYSEAGYIPATAGWTSSFLAPGCGLFLSDFDHNGETDIAVSSLGMVPYGMVPVPNYMFMNTNGLPQNPGWLSQTGHSFSCSGGDVNGDGYIDLAFSRGDYATSNAEKTFLFLNAQGAFDSIPTWQSDSLYFATDVAFADVNLDGYLDMAIGARTKGILIFMNHNGVLESTASWHSDQVNGGRQIAFGDVNNDGYPDLAVASPGQKFYLFQNKEGLLDNMPAWTSVEGNEPSAVAWADVDGDGDLDLAGGAWNSKSGIFENVNGTLSTTFSWSKSTGSGTQQIVFSDYDRDFVSDTTKTIICDGTTKLFYLGIQPIESLAGIELNGSTLPADSFCYDPVAGWISLATMPAYGDQLAIHFSFSKDLDFAVACWTYVKVFKNESINTGYKNDVGNENIPIMSQNEPNPCRETTSIKFFLPVAADITLKIINSVGLEVGKQVKGFYPCGEHQVSVPVNGLPKGLYFYQLQANEFLLTKKLIIQ